MKMIYVFTLFLIAIAESIFAQEDVTKFLGIPVDGTKSEMMLKLKEKGFKTYPENNLFPEQKEIMYGKFNGTDVNLYITTHNEKVWRIMVCDANPIDEHSIRIRFNNLCYQFNKNSKYFPAESNEFIADDEDISYGMNVKGKRYQATFFQTLDFQKDTTAMKDYILKSIKEKFSNVDITNITDEVQEEIKISIFKDYINSCFNKTVWFFITKELSGLYYITMYYDNVLNQANGEDL